MFLAKIPNPSAYKAVAANEDSEPRVNSSAMCCTVYRTKNGHEIYLHPVFVLMLAYGPPPKACEPTRFLRVRLPVPLFHYYKNHGKLLLGFFCSHKT
jgi:hypothetical protein